jgi:ATP-binding protein involved in chromosome partitioning
VAVTHKESKKIKGITSFNVNLSCVVDDETNRISCEKCEKFFDCNDENKWSVYNYGRLALAKRKMALIKYKIAIVGGKGGVGKTMLAVNIAAGLAQRGKKVAILDSDYDGSSVPRMLGINDKKLYLGKNGINPVEGPLGIKVVSMGNLKSSDEIVTWYTDSRRSATEEFITHVDYGELDYLLVDLPAGTSADTVNSMMFIPDMTGVVLITVPSEVSQGVALRAATICGKAGVTALGIVENMSGHVCRFCGNHSDIYSTGGGEKLAEATGVSLIGKIPIDGYLGKSGDEGLPVVVAYPESPSARELNKIVDQIEMGVTSTQRDLAHLHQSFRKRTWW